MHSLTVEEVDSAQTSESILEYSQMSPDQQDTFVSAVNSVDGDTGIPDEVSYEVWIDYEYVEYNNNLYRVVVSGA